MPAGTTTLVATSGGVDSVVLCHLFWASKLPFGIAHCNFQLRGEESDLDEAFVNDLAVRLDVPFFSIRFEAAQYAKQERVSTQMAARQLRYEWFEKIRETAGFQQIATAHHLDDSLETFLLNFSKGCGLRGLHGIPPRNGHVVRPLLFADKKQILEFAESNAIAYRTDTSNASDKYIRNLLRNRVVPVLEQVNPSLQQTAKLTLERLKEAEQLMDLALANIKTQVFERDGNDWYIHLDKLRSYPAQMTILFELLKPFGFNNDQVLKILQCMDQQPGKVFLSPPYQLLVDRLFLIISSRENIGGVFIIENISNSSHELPDGAVVKLTCLDAPPARLDTGVTTAYLDLEALSEPLSLRHWRPGDEFQPLGMHGGHQKIQDFFSNKKLSLVEKKRAWILESGGEIAWVVGMRLDERFKIRKTTTKTLKIEYLPTDKDEKTINQT